MGVAGGDPKRGLVSVHLVPLNVIPKIVLCHGCFDLLHLGHIRHLQEARAQGDRLFVSVTADPHVRKGIGRPRFSAEQRVEALKALDCVDDAFINDGPDAVSAIKRIKPAVYVKGIDYAERSEDLNLRCEIAAAEKYGGKFYTTKSEKWSSTRIINAETFPQETIAFLDYAREAEYLPKIREAFRKADELTVAFVGETIVDEYRYVRAIGKASKETILATVDIEREEFEGGVVAASMHAGWWKDDCVTAKQVIRKTRFVDKDFSRKLFEVYSRQTLDLSYDERRIFEANLSDAMLTADVVIVLDFGHGLIDDKAREILSDATFLAVNAQSNAGNYGFNPVTKYPRADYVSIDDPEARLAVGAQHRAIETIITELPGRMNCPRFAVTHGRYGALCFDGVKVGRIPAFSTAGIDTIGAGDAFLAVSAALVAAGLELEAAALVGNVAGAIQCSILGHRRAVRRDEIVETVEALLA